MKLTENSDRWLVVVNVFAASRKAGSLWKKAEELLNLKKIPYHSRVTGSHGNAMEITERACRDGYRKFIAVGGDGTVHDVLNGIMAHLSRQEDGLSLEDFSLAVIPVGSGNDWIKTLRVPCDIGKAVGLIASGSFGKQDVVRVSVLDHKVLPEERVKAVSYMANVGGVGLDARVCDEVNEDKRNGKRGKILYVKSLLNCIRNRVPAYARVICDGKSVFEGAYLSIAFGLGKYSGGGMRQTPEAVPDDGLLDVTLIPDIPLMRIAREVPKLFTGRFLTVPELVVSKCRSVTVLPTALCGDDVEPVEVDGEVVGRGAVRMDMLPGRLNVLIGK